MQQNKDTLVNIDPGVTRRVSVWDFDLDPLAVGISPGRPVR